MTAGRQRFARGLQDHEVLHRQPQVKSQDNDTAAVAQWVGALAPQAERWVIESQSRET